MKTKQSQNSGQQTQFKLDFNERSDNQPAWLSLAKINTDRLWRYPNREQLEQVLCADLNVSKDALLLTNGGDEGIDLLFKSSTINNTQLLIPEPCFSQYSHNAEVWNNACCFIQVDPVQPLAINQKQIIEQLGKDQWLIITRPNNPTGEFIGKDSLLAFIQAAQKEQAKVFIDFCHIFRCRIGAQNCGRRITGDHRHDQKHNERNAE
mgnify:CR=1 FL=1